MKGSNRDKHEGLTSQEVRLEWVQLFIGPTNLDFISKARTCVYKGTRSAFRRSYFGPSRKQSWRQADQESPKPESRPKMSISEAEVGGQKTHGSVQVLLTMGPAMAV